MNKPSMDEWIKQAKLSENSDKCGMYLFHNGIVRLTPKVSVRQGKDNVPNVTGMLFDFDQEKVDAAISNTYEMPGIYYVKVWLNCGNLSVGDDIMLVLVGGDIRPHVMDALNALVDEIKGNCVKEIEQY